MLASVIFVDFYLLKAQRVITTKGVLLALSGISKKERLPRTALQDEEKHSCKALTALTVRLKYHAVVNYSHPTAFIQY